MLYYRDDLAGPVPLGVAWYLRGMEANDGRGCANSPACSRIARVCRLLIPYLKITLSMIAECLSRFSVSNFETEEIGMSRGLRRDVRFGFKTCNPANAIFRIGGPRYWPSTVGCGLRQWSPGFLPCPFVPKVPHLGVLVAVCPGITSVITQGEARGIQRPKPFFNFWGQDQRRSLRVQVEGKGKAPS